MATPPGNSRRDLAWPALVAATIFGESCRSHVAGLGFNQSDKVAHFFVYGLLATLLVRLGRGPRARGLALLATALFGASDEWHQSFVPGRTCELGDWIADTSGGALAIAVYVWWPWYRTRLESRLGPQRRIENPPPVATVSSQS
jgi:hypothetical protein